MGLNTLQRVSRKVAAGRDNKPLLTLPEAAVRLGIGYEPIRLAVNTGQIPTVTLGGRRYIAAAFLDRLLAQAAATQPGNGDAPGGKTERI